MASDVSGYRDTYRATAVFLAFTGVLYLIDRCFSFSSMGLSWMMQKDTIMLYAAVIYLWFKSDKSVGFILSGIWLIQNIDWVIRILGQLSEYLLPLVLLLTGVLLYWFSSRR